MTPAQAERRIERLTSRLEAAETALDALGVFLRKGHPDINGQPDFKPVQDAIWVWKRFPRIVR